MAPTFRSEIRNKIREGKAGGATEQDIAGFYRDLRDPSPPYGGSFVPPRFRCGCGRRPITTWLFAYGITLRPHVGEWGAECQNCGRTYTVPQMRGAK